MTKFSQDIDEIKDKEGMSLLFYDFNGFKSSLSHRSNISNNNLQQSHRTTERAKNYNTMESQNQFNISINSKRELMKDDLKKQI